MTRVSAGKYLTNTIAISSNRYTAFARDDDHGRITEGRDNIKLSKAQIAEYHEQGVVVAEGILTNDDLQPVTDAISEFIDRRARALEAEGKIRNLHEHEPFDRRYALLFEQCDELANGLDIYEARIPAVFEFLGNDNLLDAVKCLVGPEITCSPIQHLRAKPPSRLTGGADEYSLPNVPWHQDAGVTLEEGDDSDIITCWIPLTDALKEHGCMQVMPGAHRAGLLEHIRDGDTMIRPDLRPDIEPRYAQVHKGGAIFMSKYTPHRSSPNTTECTMRWSFDLRYQKTGTPTGRPFHPCFVAHSVDHPESVLTDYEQWSQQWIDALEAENRNPTEKHRVKG